MASSSRPPVLHGRLRLGIAQLNPVVGDISGNSDLIREVRAKAAQEGAHLVLCPELIVAGYPPEDLVLKPAFVSECMQAVEVLAKETDDGGPGMIIGSPWLFDGKLYNAAILIDAGRIQAVRYKTDLPNYGVFDEKRVFSAGPLPGPVDFRGVRIGRVSSRSGSYRRVSCTTLPPDSISAIWRSTS